MGQARASSPRPMDSSWCSTWRGFTWGQVGWGNWYYRCGPRRMPFPGPFPLSPSGCNVRWEQIPFVRIEYALAGWKKFPYSTSQHCQHGSFKYRIWSWWESLWRFPDRVFRVMEPVERIWSPREYFYSRGFVLARRTCRLQISRFIPSESYCHWLSILSWGWNCWHH